MEHTHLSLMGNHSECLAMRAVIEVSQLLEVTWKIIIDPKLANALPKKTTGCCWKSRHLYV